MAPILNKMSWHHLWQCKTVQKYDDAELYWNPSWAAPGVSGTRLRVGGHLPPPVAVRGWRSPINYHVMNVIKQHCSIYIPTSSTFSTSYYPTLQYLQYCLRLTYVWVKVSINILRLLCCWFVSTCSVCEDCVWAFTYVWEKKLILSVICHISHAHWGARRKPSGTAGTPVHDGYGI